MGRWTVRHLPPVLATVAVLVASLVFSLWWNLHVDHNKVWYEPADLWRTMLASVRLAHGQLSQLYTGGTNLVSFPGAAVILAPAAALISALHYPLAPPIGTITDTDAWVIALPYIVLISCSVLFAADALARRMGASMGRRLLLAGAGAVALWNVVPYWGHPEDCVAVAFLLYGVDAAAAGRRSGSAWLVGLGLAIQPLVLLAVPVLAVVTAGRRVVGWLVRAAIPPAIAVGAALATNWSATWYQIVDQPNWPYIDRPTPWIALAPHLTSQTVAAGPGRSIAVGLAILAAWPAWAAWRRAEQRAGGDSAPTAALTAPPDVRGGWVTTPEGPRWAVTGAPADAAVTATALTASAATTTAATASAATTTDPGVETDGDPTPRRVPRAGSGELWSADSLVVIVWWVALALALRCAFESVMVAYYIWAGIGVGLVAAVTSWWRIIPAATLGIGLTCFCNVWWHGHWSWWSVIVVGLALLLTAAHPAIEGTDAPAPTPETERTPGHPDARPTATVNA